MNTERIIRAALGEIPFDLVIRGAKCANVYTHELYEADIGIIEGCIAHVTQPGEPGLDGAEIYEAEGKVAAPGFIDSHVHIESSMMTPASFARAVLPHGTTTILADPHEICNVLGTEGLDYFLEVSRDLPVRFLTLVPSCVPSAEGFETSKTVFRAADVSQFLSRAHVIGLGEVMNYPGVLQRKMRITDILASARDCGKFIGGHAPLLRGRELSAYLASGCESDHESRGIDEGIAKLRAGMTLECRYASNCHDMPILAKALKALGYPDNATMCTDDREPDDLLKEGHIDAVMRVAIESGVPPLQAIRMATHNAAQMARLRDRGALKAGMLADIVLLDDLDTVKVNEVFVGGRLMAKEGRMLVNVPSSDHPVEKRNTMKPGRRPEETDFLVPCSESKAKLNGIVFHNNNPFVTTRGVFEFGVKDGYVDICSENGFTVMAVIERHGVTGNIGVAPVEHLGLKYGAIAGTVTHDCHNLFVFGKNTADMKLAAQTLVDCGGGFVCVADGKVTALLELPICGLMSDLQVDELAPKVDELKEEVVKMGVGGESPLNFLTFFGLAVLPEIRLTDMGLVDSLKQKRVPLFYGKK